MDKQRNAYDDDWFIVGWVSAILLVLFVLGKYMSS